MDLKAQAPLAGAGILWISISPGRNKKMGQNACDIIAKYCSPEIWGKRIEELVNAENITN